MSGCSGNCSSCGESCSDRKQESLLAEPNKNSQVKKVIAVVSGKGGVGKSTVTSMLAMAMHKLGYKTAILDADITGPSISKAFGLHEQIVGSDDGMLPAVTPEGIKVMSINLLLPNETDPVIWRGPVIGGAVKQFWTDVCWGEVDYMFVDLPPGTGDVMLTVFQSLPIDGVVINRAVEEGQTVAAGFETPTLFTIAADLTKMQVIADVDEADIGNVENGQRVSFTVDAYPNDVFEGTVMQIRLGDSESTSSSSSTSTSTVVTYEVVISADNPDLKLKPRLTANVTIFTLERDNVLTVPTKSLRFVPDAGMLTQLGYIVSEAGKEAPAGKRLVWIKNGQELKPKAVTVGSTSGNMIEIIDGLNEGEELAVDLEASSITPAAEAETERSPFMPGPPGSNKNKKSAK